MLFIHTIGQFLIAWFNAYVLHMSGQIVNPIHVIAMRTVLYACLCL